MRELLSGRWKSEVSSSGNFQKGSITGVYTVLVEGDDTNEPIADTVRGILDGHIVLSRKLANSNHFPAIDINASISRLMNDIVAPEHLTLAARVRDVMGIYEKNADLVSIGAYKAGTNPRLDYAISKIDGINQFLTQGQRLRAALLRHDTQLYGSQRAGIYDRADPRRLVPGAI